MMKEVANCQTSNDCCPILRMSSPCTSAENSWKFGEIPSNVCNYADFYVDSEYKYSSMNNNVNYAWQWHNSQGTSPSATPQKPFAPFNPLQYPISGDEEKRNFKRETEKRRKAGSSLRRYKTPSPQLLRVRREAANARERRRMNNLNDAFEKLRTVLPETDNGRRLSKYETLQMAQQYIDCLNQILSRSSSSLH